MITDGVNGVLIDPKDPKEIAKKINKLIKDKRLYRNISKNARKMVKVKEKSHKFNYILMDRVSLNNILPPPCQ